MSENRITLDMGVMDAAVVMCEGNPGATTVVAELMKDEMGLIDLCHLDDLGIYGSNIWVGYKDICGYDIKLFREKLLNHTLVKDINAGGSVQHG